MSKSKSTTLHVGMDTHKETISVAYAVAGGAEPPVYVGVIGSQTAEVDAVIRRLHSKAATLEFAYEAGPTGYGLYRHLVGTGYRCVVAAPSLTPRRVGDKVKVDHRLKPVACSRPLEAAVPAQAGFKRPAHAGSSHDSKSDATLNVSSVSV